MKIFLQSVFGLKEPAPEAIAELQQITAGSNSQVEVRGDLVSVVIRATDEKVIDRAKAIIQGLEPKMLGWGRVMIYDGAGLFDECTVGYEGGLGRMNA
ncbi:MAG: hypothetical protein RBU21_25705 [FCB group bacterium]|nr:hypothetical protein [FCB group bacterium]